jgi:major membrane immunogen (membrane-anchored lipoprotein)
MTSILSQRRTARIRELNDMLRRSFIGGHVVITSGVRERGQAFESACVEAVQSFRDFTEDNDPHGEHDFGAVTVQNTRVFFKVDYYDRDLRFGSEDPADPLKTARVLTIMLVTEY